MGDRNYSEATRSALFAVSISCYFPECGQPTVSIFGDGTKKNVQIAHIRAVHSNGPRYNPPGLPAMTLEQRNNFANLILLCDMHHGMVDKKANESSYPVELLLAWKTKAEKGIRSKIDGLDRLTEERLDQMLTMAAKDTKRELGSAIDKLSQVSRGAADILRALYARIESHYLDRDAVAMLESASHRLGSLQDGASTLYSASVQLGNLEDGSNRLLEAARLLQGLNDASARLEGFASDYSRMLDRAPAMPTVPDISGQIEDACDTVLARIDRKMASIDFGDPPVIVNDEQRWKYALWGFFAGVMAVMVTVAVLAYSGKI